MLHNSFDYDIIQNLKDAGCDAEMVEQFMKLEEKGSTKDQLRLLLMHRDKLLEQVHMGERRIECLDYLVYQIQKRRNAV